MVSYPSIHQSAMAYPTNNISKEFNKLLGNYGTLRNSVVVWQYLTLCYSAINRHGASVKCLEMALSALCNDLDDTDAQFEAKHHKLIDVIDSGLLVEQSRLMIE